MQAQPALTQAKGSWLRKLGGQTLRASIEPSGCYALPRRMHHHEMMTRHYYGGRELEEVREANRRLMAAAGEVPAANGSTAAHAERDPLGEQALTAARAAAQAAHERVQAAEADAARQQDAVKHLTGAACAVRCPCRLPRALPHEHKANADQFLCCLSRAERLQASQQECVQLRAAGEEARASAAKLEADLEGLSGAYNALEAHFNALEVRLRGLEASSGSGAPGTVSGKPACSCSDAPKSTVDRHCDGLQVRKLRQRRVQKRMMA